MEELKKLLNYDGPITYGEGKVTLSLTEDLHNWIMSKINGQKWKRGGFIRSQLLILKEGHLIYSKQVIMEKPRTPTLAERKNEIARKKKKKKLSKKDIIKIEKQETLIGINVELKERFARMRDPKFAPDPPPTPS